MCRPVSCRTCGKTTWSGCGNHVEQVMATVPRGDRCTCARDDSPSKGSGFLASLFGR